MKTATIRAGLLAGSMMIGATVTGATMRGAVAGALLLLLPASSAWAASFTVTNANDSGVGSLRQAIIDANTAGGSSTISFTSGFSGTITLSSGLPVISSSVTIDGSAAAGGRVTIDGGGGNRIFFAGDGTAISVDLQHLTLQNGTAKGGDGGGNAGGGMGAGGALFVNKNVAATLSDVQFAGNQAVGGNGGTGARGGGGGLGGNGGNTQQNNLGAGGGGGGYAGNGGLGGQPANPNGGGGGGGETGNGGDGTTTTAGTGGTGGGGAGGYNGAGTPGNTFGGGGGGGTGYGGNGGDFGGGGGSNFAFGGNGGFGGGGGAGNGGNSSGGFGGGSASGNSGTGGGGSGYGGAIFVRDGASITIVDSGFSGGSVTPGAGSTSGQALGTAMFLGADVTYSVTSGTIILSDSIGGIGANINADGGLTKAGAGTLILNGQNSYAGGTTVTGGELQVGDAAHANARVSGDVTVGAAGTLAGHGTVVGQVDNSAGGMVSPGGSIGTLHVGGNYTQGATSTLRIEVSPTAASQLAVGGTANLGGGTLALVFTPGVYSTRSYTIVTATGGLGGSQFGAMTQSGVTGLDPQVSYTTTTALLAIIGNAGTGGFTVAPTNGQVFGATTSSLVLGAQAANRALFGHLSDRRLGAVGTDTLRTAFAGNDPTGQAAFGGDLAGLNLLAAALPEALAKHGGWFRATGGFGNIDGGSLHDVDSHGGGFMAGYDYQLTDTFLIGGAVGYSRTDLSQSDGSSAEINTPRVAVYGSYQLGGFALDGNVGYAYDRIKTRNQSDGGTATSQHDAHEINVGLQASYRVDLPQRIALTPRVGLDYLHLFEDGFTEKGAQNFDLTSKGGDLDSLKPSVGLSVARTFETDGGTKVTPQLDLTYSHEVLDDGRNAQVLIGGGAFTVQGVKPSRDELALGVSLTASLSQNFDLYGGYTALLPVGNTVSHNFSAGLRVTF